MERIPYQVEGVVRIHSCEGLSYSVANFGVRNLPDRHGASAGSFFRPDPAMMSSGWTVFAEDVLHAVSVAGARWLKQCCRTDRFKCENDKGLAMDSTEIHLHVEHAISEHVQRSRAEKEAFALVFVWRWRYLGLFRRRLPPTLHLCRRHDNTCAQIWERNPAVEDLIRTKLNRSNR